MLDRLDKIASSTFFRLVGFLSLILPFALIPISYNRFAASDNWEEISQIISFINCTLLALIFAGIAIFKKEIKNSKGQKINRGIFLILILLIIYPCYMFGKLGLASGIGHYLNQVSKQECVFSDQIIKKRNSTQKYKSCGYYLNLQQHTGLNLTWCIHTKEAEALPKTFYAKIYASESYFGTHILSYKEQGKENLSKIEGTICSFISEAKPHQPENSHRSRIDRLRWD